MVTEHMREYVPQPSMLEYLAKDCQFSENEGGQLLMKVTFYPRVRDLFFPKKKGRKIREILIENANFLLPNGYTIDPRVDPLSKIFSPQIDSETHSLTFESLPLTPRTRCR